MNKEKRTWGTMALISAFASVFFLILQVGLIREYETMVPLIGLGLLFAILSVLFSVVQIKHKKTPAAIIALLIGCIMGIITSIGLLDFFRIIRM